VVTVGGATAALLRLGVPMEQIPNRLAVFAQLRNGQSADGGYLKVGLSVTDLDGTYRVGRALYMAKQAPADRAKLLAFVQKCYNADGGFGTAPGQPSSASGTYYAVLIRQWFADQGK
jgi:prenyltransferase beta subunit